MNRARKKIDDIGGGGPLANLSRSSLICPYNLLMNTWLPLKNISGTFCMRLWFT